MPFLLRIVALPLLCLAAAGCANTPTLQSLVNVYRHSRAGTPDAAVTRADVDRSPYASIGVRIGKAGRAHVVLARYDGADLHWVSADRITFVTRAGRLVRTAGLPHDLAAIRGPETDPLQQGLHRLPAGGASYTRYLDLAPGAQHREVGFVSRFSVAGEETITILGRSYRTLRVVESVNVSRWQWQAENVYWVDPGTGFVWKSVQQYAPDVPPIQIEVFRPAI